MDRGTSQKYLRRNCSSETAAKNCAAEWAICGEFEAKNWVDWLSNKGLEILFPMFSVSGCLVMWKARSR